MSKKKKNYNNAEFLFYNLTLDHIKLDRIVLDQLWEWSCTLRLLCTGRVLTLPA